LSRISVRSALCFAFGFSARRLPEILSRILIPALAGGAALYAAFFLYLVELERYLVHPNERSASLVLGAATAGLLLTLFMHSVATASVTSLALGQPDQGWRYFCVSRRAWRLFAAYLRFLIVCAAYISAVAVLRNSMAFAGAAPRFDYIAGLLMFAGIMFLVVRVGFLIAPVAVAGDTGPILRQAWRRSYSEFGKIALIVSIILLVGLTVEAVGEFVLQATGSVPMIGYATTPRDVVVAYRILLPKIMVATGAAYLVTIVLMIAAAVGTYRRIIANQAT
jgi:hypothetical protein